MSITLTLLELEAMLHEPVRDKRYLDTRLGPSVRAYLSWKENEAGAAERTLDQYERDLARLCITLADHDVGDVTTDELRHVRDTFPKGSRKRATAAYRDFWRWLYQEGRIDRDPMARVRYPKRESEPVLDVFTGEEEARLITAQQRIRDRLGVALLLDSGIRASEIRHLRVEDVDLVERWIIVRRGKGGKGRVVPIRGRVVLVFEEFLLTPFRSLSASQGRRTSSSTQAAPARMGQPGAIHPVAWLRLPFGVGGTPAATERVFATGSRTHLGTPTPRN